MDVFDHIETEARRHWDNQTDAFVIDPDCLRQRLERAYNEGALSWSEFLYLDRLIEKAELEGLH